MVATAWLPAIRCRLTDPVRVNTEVWVTAEFGPALTMSGCW